MDPWTDGLSGGLVDSWRERPGHRDMPRLEAKSRQRWSGNMVHAQKLPPRENSARARRTGRERGHSMVHGGPRREGDSSLESGVEKFDLNKRELISQGPIEYGDYSRFTTLSSPRMFVPTKVLPPIRSPSAAAPLSLPSLLCTTLGIH